MASLLVGCDPHAEDADTGGSDDTDTTAGTGADTDTGGGGACELDTPPPGAALLDAANCIHQDTDVVFASCSSTDPMLRPCDVAFMEWCNAYGGDVVACEEQEILAREHRCGGGPAFLPCDPTFTAACDGADGVFACDDPSGDTCRSGSCAQPPDVEPIVVCCKHVDVPSGTGDNCEFNPNGQNSLTCGPDKIALACGQGAVCYDCEDGGPCLCQCTGGP